MSTQEKKMSTYNISGSITIYLDFDIESDSEEQAFNDAVNELKDFYHLDSKGIKILPTHHSISIDAIETNTTI
jgi:hypothetical protein